MKTKKRKQRKITDAQVKTLEKKLIVLSHKQTRITKQITPLKITLRKYIQQNMEALEAHVTPPGIEHNKIRWAMDKIKRGYFGDAKLWDLLEIAHFLNVVRWREE